MYIMLLQNNFTIKKFTGVVLNVCSIALLVFICHFNALGQFYPTAKPIDPSKESELLKLFCQNINQPISRSFALKTIWGDDSYFNARSMDVYITKLRKHFKEDPSIQIMNLHGEGFKLMVG